MRTNRIRHAQWRSQVIPSQEGDNPEYVINQIRSLLLKYPVGTLIIIRQSKDEEDIYQLAEEET